MDRGNLFGRPDSRYPDFTVLLVPCVLPALQQQRQETIAAWQSECNAVKDRKEAAAAARAKAESDYSNAHTQQEAERAERAIKEATAALKVGSAVQGRCRVSLHKQTCH